VTRASRRSGVPGSGRQGAGRPDVAPAGKTAIRSEPVQVTLDHLARPARQTPPSRSSAVAACCHTGNQGRRGPSEPPAGESATAFWKSGTPVITEYQFPLKTKLFTSRGVTTKVWLSWGTVHGCSL